MSDFHAYDIRGKGLTPEFAYGVGFAFSKTQHMKTVVVGYDARIDSEQLANSVIDGLIDSSCNVIFIGFCSTPQLWFAVNHFKSDGGIMVTASHNPAEYNGFKFCGKGAVPISMGTGLEKIEKFLEEESIVVDTPGKITQEDILSTYLHFLLSFSPQVIQKKIVLDCSNGVVGPLLPRLFENIEIDVVFINREPDGTFPNHEPNPLLESALLQCKEKVKEEKADFGAVFDGDGDRVVFIDEKGNTVLSSSILSVLCALFTIDDLKVVGDLGLSRAFSDSVKGTYYRSKVGRSNIIHEMNKHKAHLGGEVSGHFMFADFFGADSAVRALLGVLAYVSEHSELPFSQLIEQFTNYAQSGEINKQVADADTAIELVKKTYHSGKIDELDGVFVEFDEYWFNVRKSNTEPLIRIRMEAVNEEVLNKELEKLLSLL